MAGRAPPGRLLQPDAPEDLSWAEGEHPGMVLREAVLDAQGNVVSEKVRRVPLDRELQAALEWARSKYWDGTS